MDVQIILDDGGAWAVWAAVGNVVDGDGVSVCWEIDGHGEVRIDFPTRQDALAFLRALADAAEGARPGECGMGATLAARGAFSRWQPVT